MNWIVIFTDKGMEFTSTYARSMFLDYRKKNPNQEYNLKAEIKESVKARGYMEGGVIPAYCKWQYDINPRSPELSERRRFLFKQDFHYDILENRKGDPIRATKSSKGQATQILNLYTRYAEENGAPIPNPALFKLYRDKWRSSRFPTFFDFLDFLKLECDAMPSKETLDLLEEEDKIEYPENDLGKSVF